MKFTTVFVLFVMALAGCSSKKKETTPKKVEPAVKTPEKQPEKAHEKTPVAKPAPSQPDVVIKDKGDLTDAEIAMVKTITQSLINKAINSKVDLMVDKLAKQMGKDNLSKHWPLFVKGAIKSFTAVGVSLVVNAVLKKMGKKMTSEIIERIVKPMIQKAAKEALDNAFSNVMGK